MRLTASRKTILAGGSAMVIAAGVAVAFSTHNDQSSGNASLTVAAPPSAHVALDPRFDPPPVHSTVVPKATKPAAPAAAPKRTRTHRAATPKVVSQPPAVIPAAEPAGWSKVFQENFSTNVGLGGFDSSSYASRWYTYSGSDSSGNGTYSTAQTVSVGGGVLDMYLHTANGQALSAALVPQVPGSGQVYGRYSVRFRADPMQNFGAAFLLWPDSNDWNQGEIDFPEAPFNGTLSIHDHCVGSPQNSCYDVDTGVTWANWHVATTEWTPGLVRFYIDGRLVGQSHVSPTAKMHMVMQTGTDGGKPNPSVAGHVQIDWVSIWRLA